MSLRSREQLVREAFLAGNVPPQLRRLVPIHFGATIAGEPHEIVYWVTADYLAVGGSLDFARVPLTAPMAQLLADELGCVLPTRKMVDDIYRAAEVVVVPRPFHPRDHDITSAAVFAASNAAIETARAGRSGLIAGIKKDVVVTPRLAEQPGRVAIYGWHRAPGKPIQSLSCVHVDSYVDYSHGARLVWRTVLIDGIERDVDELLADQRLWPLVSDEGPFRDARYSTSARRP